MLLVKGRVKSDVEVAAVRKLLLKKVACPIAEKIMRTDIPVGPLDFSAHS